MMRINHISDTHGNFPKMPGNYDVVVFSGDFFPSTKYHSLLDKTQEISNQKLWLERNIENVKAWLNDKPFLFILGNHDFVDPDWFEEKLNNHDIEAVNLTDKLVEFQGIGFYGFPWIPSIDGTWNYECSSEELKVKANEAYKIIKHSMVEVLVSHGPINKILDLTFSYEHVGNMFISDLLEKVDYFLCGHIHEAKGIASKNGVLFSNAAMSSHIIEIA